jgi:very-short-patch-repair endonuclease
LAQAGHLQAIAAIVKTAPRPRPDWFAPGRLADLDDLVSQAAQHHETVTTGRTQLASQFNDEFFEVATADLASRFNSDYSSWLRFFRPAYHREIGRLRGLLREPGQLGYDQALVALNLARRVKVAQDWHVSHRDELSTGLGRHFDGARTNWTSVATSIASVRELIACLDGREPPARMLTLLVDGSASLKSSVVAFDTALTAAHRELDHLATLASLDDLPFGGRDVVDVPMDALATWLGDWLEMLCPLWEAVETIGAHRPAGPTQVATLAAEVGEAQALREVKEQLDAAATDLQADFGHLFNGLATRWEDIQEALGWSGRLLLHFPTTPPEGFVVALGNGTTVSAAAQEQLSEGIRLTSQRIEEVQPRFTDAAYRIDGRTMTEAPLFDITTWAELKRGSLPQLEEWIDLDHALRVADHVGLAPFVEALRRERPLQSCWRDACLRQIYILWLTWRYDHEPALASFRMNRHEESIRDFRRLDRLQWQAASRRIAQRLVQKRPIVTLGLPPQSEPAILVREASKKKKFRPLRRLFADMPNLLLALKPCLLMSPLSVAQYLGDSAVTFDVVVFDEASQILPADAIGAIGRGRQLVVVGDQQQLPPTRFFAVDLNSSEDNDDDEEVPESILDACLAARLPSMPLLWHYRSRHEHLIAFSNRWFYNRRLVTFPSPDEHERAVQFVHVPGGVYDRAASRSNRAEAQRIGDLVIEHVQRHPRQSLGVIAFSAAQTEAIEIEIEARKRARPELEPLLSEEGLDGFFVKNLENVQGDERDVIFFSVGYGPDHTGHMRMNFGPLNRQGGERRLNVAITRARQRVMILASFLPHDIDPNRTQAKGVILLRQYLEFAQKGPIALLGEITAEGGEPDSPFEVAVADALAARGLRVVYQVGVGAFRIDLGIKDAATDRYLLGIECDGATYHSSRTARDRDRLRQQVLEQLGWRIHRIWSTDWIKFPEQEIDRVLAALERARTPHPHIVVEPVVQLMSDGSSPSMFSEPNRKDGPAPIAPDPVPVAPIAQTYSEAKLPRQGDIEIFRQKASGQLSNLVRSVVAAEGPVHEDRVMRAVAASFDIARVGSQVRDRLVGAIDRAVRDQAVVRVGAFLWPPMMQTPLVRAANEAGKVRPIHEVAPEELAAAIQVFVEHAFAINRDDLISGVARELGYDRTGSLISEALSKRVNAMIADGVLIENGGQIRCRPVG